MNGMVATSQPLAARVGLRTLEDGGNAVDAAIATAATLAVVEPAMTGIGGDVFALVAVDEEVVGLNGSGGAPQTADVDTYRRGTDVVDDGQPVMPETGGLPVTVPGALDAWERLLDRFGTRALADVLRPAISYAREGFPVTQVVADEWRRATDRLQGDTGGETFLPDGDPPDPGQRFTNPALADTFELIAREGTGVLYGGEVGVDVVEAVQGAGGMLSLDDLLAHEATWTEPLSTTYRGVEVLEHPPNGQGTIALEALNIAAELDPPPDPTDPGRWHRLIEATKIGFADGHAYISDPMYVDVPLGRMLASEYAAERAAEVESNAGRYNPRARGDRQSDTVYLSVVDGGGNAVSFINSIYSPFGSGVVARGFALQNRGHSFSLDPGHANVVEPGKRPFHTIIPAMLRERGEVRASWGVMGGQMQPQGHVQVVSNLVDRGLDPQAALDEPRYRWLDTKRVALETTRISDAVVAALRERGHTVLTEEEYVNAGGHWGGGQVIYRRDDGTLIGGSDPRKDGCALGF